MNATRACIDYFTSSEKMMEVDDKSIKADEYY